MSKKERIEGFSEEIELKMLECSSCGSGYVLYDSRDVERIDKYSPAMRKSHEERVAANASLEGKTCRCGKGIYTLFHNKWEENYKGYILVTCDCGEKVECHHFTNTCSCGVDYNHSGSRLASREQWGEETGEHWLDCI